MLYCHCQIWLISNRSLTMFYNQDRTFTPGCFFYHFLSWWFKFWQLLYDRTRLDICPCAVTSQALTQCLIVHILSKEPTQGIKCPQRRLNQQPITTEPCVPHSKSCWIIFQLIWHHKVRKVKSVPLYRTLESISDTWYFNGVLSFL